MSAGGWPLIFHALVSVFPMRRSKEQFASLALIGSPYVCDIYIDLSVIFISWLANRPGRGLTDTMYVYVRKDHKFLYII